MLIFALLAFGLLVLVVILMLGMGFNSQFNKLHWELGEGLSSDLLDVFLLYPLQPKPPLYILANGKPTGKHLSGREGVYLLVVKYGGAAQFSFIYGIRTMKFHEAVHLHIYQLEGAIHCDISSSTNKMLNHQVKMRTPERDKELTEQVFAGFMDDWKKKAKNRWNLHIK